MPRAEIFPVDVPGPCPNCGRERGGRVHVVSAKGVSAWQGCNDCWRTALCKGQLDVIKALCRLADEGPQGPQPADVLSG